MLLFWVVTDFGIMLTLVQVPSLKTEAVSFFEISKHTCPTPFKTPRTPSLNLLYIRMFLNIARDTQTSCQITLSLEQSLTRCPGDPGLRVVQLCAVPKLCPSTNMSRYVTNKARV